MIIICCIVFPVVETMLKFTYVEKYPDEPPLCEIYSQENLEDSDAADILTLLQQQVCPFVIRVTRLFQLSDAQRSCFLKSLNQ